MIISLDTETTGLDFKHGVKPYLVTTCNDKGQINWWEWLVDGRTRQPDIPEEEKQEIVELMDSADAIVMHNAKFDIHMLGTILPDYQFPYHKLHDTLSMAHMLRSNRPKNLTALAFDFLKTNIEKYEKRMEECVKDARQYVKSNKLTSKFRVAKKDSYKDMPSAKEKTWKYDSWLPRALAIHENFPQGHDWYTVTSTYANKDSETTLRLFYYLQDIIKMRKLGKIYQESMKLIKITHDLEERGVTTDLDRSKKMFRACQEEMHEQERICKNIAAEYGCDLTLPKGGTNKVLFDFCFGKNGLNLEPRYNEKAKSTKPSLDKEAIRYYESVLDTTSKELLFVKSLNKYRQIGTAKRYLEGYSKFWLPHPQYQDGNVRILYPNMNITGTATLRFSCNNPNSQNIGKDERLEGYSLRRCFGPAPGREWYSLDAKNIELRIPAYKSGEESLIELFERPDDPPFYGSNHMLIFSVIWEDLWKKAIDKVGIENAADYCKTTYKATYYQWTKNGDFAVQYQAGDATADKAYHQLGARKKVIQRFAKQEALNQECVRFANKHGYIETFPDREVDPDRGYPLLCSNVDGGKVKPTIPLSYKIQGTAMFFTRRSMVKTHEQLDQWYEQERFDGFITMQVHDELVFDFPKSEVSPIVIMEEEKKGGVTWERQKQSNLWRVRQLAKLMESCGDAIGVPIPVGIDYHESNWHEGYKIQ